MSTTASAASARVLVLQLGARLHYAVPAVYARAGALQALYTDACASVAPLVWLRYLPPRYRPAFLQRLLGRTLPPEVPRDRVRVETLAALGERLPYLGRTAGSRAHERLRQRILDLRFEGANCLYCLDGSDIELMKRAKGAGLAVVYEQIICPTVGRILRDERSRFPKFERQDPEAEVEGGIERDIEIFRLADRVVCGSDFVRDDVLGLTPEARPVVAPYGVNQDWLESAADPIPGRILFVGSVGLRKGSHYLAHAARLLAERGLRCDVRVVGPYDPAFVARPELQGPTYVGQIPRDAVRAEFACADVFVLPSLAEGAALVTMEALACGVPVVTTANAGSQVRHGEEGFVVPIRDAAALADAIEHVVSDRGLRASLSMKARARARTFSWQAFGAVVMDATENALSERAGQ